MYFRQKYRQGGHEPMTGVFFFGGILGEAKTAAAVDSIKGIP